jgi:lysophospholipase L1-like esterase
MSTPHALEHEPCSRREQTRPDWRAIAVRLAITGLLGLLLVVDGLTAHSAVAAQPEACCQYVLGFKLLHAQIPEIVGDCRSDEYHNPSNGDGLQETTGRDGRGGLLVWRKADNWTAYTDGYRTWVSGPAGLQTRLNTQRFDWERDPIVPQPPATQQPTIQAVFLGDSHFEYWQLETVFVPARVVNRGIAGQTSEDVLRRFAGDVVAVHPHGVLILAGTNDALRGVPAAQTESNLCSMLEQARAHGIAGYVLTIPPLRPGSQLGDGDAWDRNQRVRGLDGWIEANAPTCGGTVVDAYAALVDDLGYLAFAYARPDGVHLNASGYDRLARLIVPIVQQLK